MVSKRALEDIDSRIKYQRRLRDMDTGEIRKLRKAGKENTHEYKQTIKNRESRNRRLARLRAERKRYE